MLSQDISKFVNMLMMTKPELTGRVSMKFNDRAEACSSQTDEGCPVFDSYGCCFY